MDHLGFKKYELSKKNMEHVRGGGWTPPPGAKPGDVWRISNRTTRSSGAQDSQDWIIKAVGWDGDALIIEYNTDGDPYDI